MTEGSLGVQVVSQTFNLAKISHFQTCVFPMCPASILLPSPSKPQVNMERALQMPEIVLEILEIVEFLDADSDSQSRNTLAAVARSCKTLASVALDILWRGRLSLIQIFGVIPIFRYNDTTRMFVSPASTLTILVLTHCSAGLQWHYQDEDWVRFESCTSRVHQIDEEGEISIESLVFFRTAQYFQGKPMFPSLKSLSLCDSYISLPLLVSPSLRDINLVEDGPSGSQTTLIQSICDGSPSLEYFGFCGDLQRSSYALLSQLPYLHHFDIDADVIPVAIIASFQSLTDFDLTMDISEIFNHVDRKPFGLQDLRNITITAPLKFVIFMLKALSKSPLQDLDCTVPLPWQSGRMRSTLSRRGPAPFVTSNSSIIPRSFPLQRR